LLQTVCIITIYNAESDGAAMRRDEGREELSCRVEETCKWIYITFVTVTVIVCAIVIWIRRVS